MECFKEKSSKRYSVYIYGAGNEYNHFMQIYPLYRDKIYVSAVVTAKRAAFSSIDGFPCITIEEIEINSIDYIIVAVEVGWRDVIIQLNHLGIDTKRIIRSKAFFIPGFELDKYLNLKKNNVTIISNYCLGGHLYNDLGLECLSPTKNCFCRSDHYFRFIDNLKYFLGLDMSSCETVCVDFEKEFASYAPKGIIDNQIEWHFNHDRSLKEAIENWNRRRKKVNFDNIVILMECHSEEDAYRLSEVQGYRKLGLYYKPLDLSDIVCAPLWNEPEIQIKYMWNWPTFANRFFTNKDGWVSPINWISFLNGEEDYIRYTFQQKAIKSKQ